MASLRPGVNDLATTDPDLAAQLVDPDLAATVTRGSHKKLRWFCEGTDELPHPRREWTAAVASRSAGRGCAVCAPTGFDPSRPAWLYFLHHDGWAMQQVGITNDPDERIGTHKRSGWELVGIRKYDDGVLCASTEQAALTALRLRGARLGNDRHRFDGYTESWDTLSLGLDGLDQLLEWVRQDEWREFRE